jgi:FtsH-binding integral membrane protein
LWLLLASNGVTILLALTQDWNVLPLMWICWFQNIVIGFFHFLRIRRLKEFSTEGFSINGRPAQPTQETKNHVARFFLLHYGGFHLAYFVFLLAFSRTGWLDSAGENGFSSADVKYVILAAVVFLGNHVFSYFYNRPRDTGRPNIGTVMFYPYARILPMHLTIILGAFLGGGLLLFLLLKTLADLIMHVVEHRVLLRRQARQVPDSM